MAASSFASINYRTCQCEDYDTPVISFEGPEKRILAYFRQPEGRKTSLRDIDSSVWARLLSHVGCEILSEMRNDYCTSFVLSESSLFVFDNHYMIKTCGRTRLLKFLEPVREEIANHNLELVEERVVYSRKNFYFPEAQFSPHRSWTEEHDTLQRILPGGKEKTLGSDDQLDQWFTYVWEDSSSEKAHDYEQSPVFEVMMMHLSRSKMEQFYEKQESSGVESESQATEGGAHSLASGNVKYPVTSMSGIEHLIPGSMIDDFQFSPCGYSMNGLCGRHYWTIHITPEPQCSYVSFETNAPLSSPGAFEKLLNQLMTVFEPGRFSATVFGKNVNLPLSDVTLHGFHGYPVDSEMYWKRQILLRNFISDSHRFEVHEHRRVLQFVEERQRREEVAPFYIVNTHSIERKMNLWKEKLPRVRPYYNVSCNSSPQVLKLVHSMGAGFDCFNSKDVGYMSDIRDAEITLSNPYFKQVRDLMMAASWGVQHIVIDSNVSELEKIAKYAPNSDLIIRINTSHIVGNEHFLGSRFDQSATILRHAKRLGLRVVGVSLVHVIDRKCTCDDRLNIWIADSLHPLISHVFSKFSEYGYEPSVLDIGGSIWSTGLGLEDGPDFYRLATGISKALDQLFPKKTYPKLQIVASDCAPFLVSQSHTLVCQVFANKTIEEGKVEYFVNDGYSGSLSQSRVTSISDRHHLRSKLTRCRSSSSASLADVESDLSTLLSHTLDIRHTKSIQATTSFVKGSIFGPSCDKMLDCLCKDVHLPELDVGDFCYFLNMGAVQHHYAHSQSDVEYVFIHEND